MRSGDSIIGRRIDRVLYTTMTFFPSSFQVATGDVRLSGSVVDVDPASGRATRIARLAARLPEDLSAEFEAEGDADEATG